MKDCCKLLTIKRGAILAARAEVGGVIERGIAAVRSGSACIIRDAEVDGETAKYTNSPATVGGKGVSHSMQRGAVGGASFCSSATWGALQWGFWHWIKVLRTVVLPRGLCPAHTCDVSCQCSVNRRGQLAVPATRLSFPPVANLATASVDSELDASALRALRHLAGTWIPRRFAGEIVTAFAA